MDGTIFVLFFFSLKNKNSTELNGKYRTYFFELKKETESVQPSSAGRYRSIWIGSNPFRMPARWKAKTDDSYAKKTRMCDINQEKKYTENNEKLKTKKKHVKENSRSKQCALIQTMKKRANNTIIIILLFIHNKLKYLIYWRRGNPNVRLAWKTTYKNQLRATIFY